MTRKYPDPSPPQGELDLEPFRLNPPTALKATCANAAARLSQDQYRCAACGLVWDVDEERPPCLTSTAP